MNIKQVSKVASMFSDKFIEDANLYICDGFMTHNNIMVNQLPKDVIFVFGSNEAGIHGAGAAKTALNKFGAVYGQGEGLYGQSYAIPTKDKYIKTLPYCRIETYVDNFMWYAKDHPELVFYVTEVGCGLAGLSQDKIGHIFKYYISLYQCSNNVILPINFVASVD